MISYDPTYNVKYYREGVYKLIRFNSPRGCRIADQSSEDTATTHDQKLAAALSRAKSVIYQLAMCNDWKFFFSGTLDETKMNRYDLFVFRSRFSQFVRDQRKQSGYEDLRYVLVPEKHKNGAWHMHGLISGLPEEALSYFVPGVHPISLVEGGYRNWDAYAQKFGYCSLGQIKDQDAVSAYLVKYLSKEMQNSVTELGNHTYFCSQGLRRALPFGSIYGERLDLERYLDHHGPYVSSGFVRDVSWDFWLDYLDLSNITQLFDPAEELAPEQIEEFEQLPMLGFPAHTYRSPYLS